MGRKERHFFLFPVVFLVTEGTYRCTACGEVTLVNWWSPTPVLTRAFVCSLTRCEPGLFEPLFGAALPLPSSLDTLCLSFQTHLPNIKVHAYFAPVTPPPSVGGSRQRFCRCCIIL